MAHVILENVYKSFPSRSKNLEQKKPEFAENLQSNSPGYTSSNQAILRRINLTVRDGEFMVLVGPSGCGKSTLLRLIAGLDELSAGNIWVGDMLVNELPPKERDIAMVFQSYALYPHLTVYDNIAFGLRRAKLKENNPRETQDFYQQLTIWVEKILVAMTRSLPKNLRYMSETEKTISDRVEMVAKMLQIESLLDRLPKELSGGQKQRVALGRAIARNPQVFLMDEPLSNLDAKLRTETRTQIVKLQRHLNTTTIYVTHDQTEAMTMGDRIAVMNAGQIQQIAAPLDIYNRPANRFVAEFIGSPPMNFLPVQFQAPQLIIHPQFRFSLSDNWVTALKNYDGNSLILGIRPEHLNVSVPALKNIQVKVNLVEALGNETLLHVNLVDVPSQPPLLVRTDPDRIVKIGEIIWLGMNIQKIHLFDPQTNMAIIPAIEN